MRASGWRTVVVVLGGVAVTATTVAAAGLSVSVRNPTPAARAAETITLTRAQLAPLGAADLRTIAVRDEQAGRALLTQAIDLGDDGTFDEVIFQLDLAPSEERTLSVVVGERRIPKYDDYRVYGRFNRERRDDFAWENDLVAHRMYGAALERWKQEPLTSSTVDVWSKRTADLVQNRWYLVDDYHRDTGEGADFYSAGRSRGCGGNAPWVSGRLWPSSNFRDSRVIANGPIRVLFELTYEGWNVNGQSVTEVKRISLDAGHQMNRFESRYASAAPLPTHQAIGIKKVAAETIATDSRDGAYLLQWEPIKGNGHLACAVIVPDAGSVTEITQDELNRLLVTRIGAEGTVTYYAGSAWDRGGRITTPEAWVRYVEAWAGRVRTPVVVTVKAS